MMKLSPMKKMMFLFVAVAVIAPMPSIAGVADGQAHIFPCLKAACDKVEKKKEEPKKFSDASHDAPPL